MIEKKEMIGNENINWDLLAKYLSKETNNHEDEFVENWLNASPDNLEEFIKIQKTWYYIGIFEKLDGLDTEKSLKKLKSRFTTYQSKKFNFRPLLKIAAVVLLLITIGFISIYVNNLKYNNFAEIYSGNKNTISKTLPDGSVISLNANTTIKYPEKFTKHQRKVFLSGEAFFEVKPDKNSPFIIETNKSEIKVLGTSFNVKAYKKSDKTTVSVNSGLVEVRKKNLFNNEIESVLLGKGSMGIVPKSNNAIDKSIITNQNYLAWRTKIIEFNKTPLYEVKDVLESVYQVEICFKNNDIKELRLTAKFNNENFDNVINVINLTFDLNCSITGSTIEFSEK